MSQVLKLLCKDIAHFVFCFVLFWFMLVFCLFFVASLCRYCFVADSRVDSGPLCLSLHKPISARDALHRHDVDGAMENRKSAVYGLQANPGKTARQLNQPNYRSRSEPLEQGRSRHQAHSLQNSPQDRLLRSKADLVENSVLKRESFFDKDAESQQSEDLKNGYNYVLSLAPSPGPDSHAGSSLPTSPMQVPIKYPKSMSYTISSDEEDAPEDLSFSSSHNNQPENLTVSKPHVPPTGLAVKDQNSIKYDSNANAVAVPVAQLSNGQLIAQSPIPIPQNLIFHDPRTVNSMVGQPQLMHLAPKSISHADIVGSISQNSINSHQPLLLANQAQIANMRGPPPLMMPSMVSPISSSQILVPINTVVSSNSLQAPLTPKATSSDDNQSLDGSGQRKKRKKMEDTTVFRDPPEQSLPFNGPNKYRFYCDVCDTGFTRRYTFNRHKCKGRVEKHYCQLCDKAYLSKYKLKDHILVKHEGQTVSCPECGKRFSSRSSMEMHKKQQHEGQYSIFCKICGKGFNHTGHYYGHMNKHTNTKPFWCQQCGKRFYGSSYLHNHKQVCRGNNDLNFACTICDRKFKCELYLKKHMKIHDNTPIIANPNVAKATDEDLTKAGVQLAAMDQSSMSNGGDSYMSMPIFPNGPDYSDSSSNSALMIDEKGDKEGNNNIGSGDNGAQDMSIA